jgi:glycosyltransferase involved in cell wall biosynthesis
MKQTGRETSMKNKPLKIGITAFTIFPGGGLLHFLNQAIHAMALARPDWRFTVIGSIALEKQIRATDANVVIRFWDGDWLSRSAFRCANLALAPLGRAGDAGFLLQSRCERYRLPWGNPQLLKELLAGQDILWTPYYNIALGRLALSELFDASKTPALLTIHDVHPALYPEDYPPELIYRFYRQFGQFATNCARVITHSQFQRNAIQQTLAVEAGKIFVTPQPPLNKPDELLKIITKPEATQILAGFGIQGRYVFYPASTLHGHKNHARLLLAWSELKQHLGSECPLLVFTYQGNRAQAERTRALIDTLQLQSLVRFTGQVDNRTLATLFQNCDLVVIPTLFEGAGSGILTDALTAGKPIACARIPPILEQLETFPGVRVSFFDPLSVPDIAAVIEQSWRNLAEMRPVTEANQQIALQRFSGAWAEWANFHTSLMEATV